MGITNSFHIRITILLKNERNNYSFPKGIRAPFNFPQKPLVPLDSHRSFLTSLSRTVTTWRRRAWGSTNPSKPTSRSNPLPHLHFLRRYLIVRRLLGRLVLTATTIPHLSLDIPAGPKKETPNERFCWVIECRFFGSISGVSYWFNS